MDITILIADDDRILRELLCDILRKQNYHPIEACDGKEAIDIFFSDQKIDLVILDVMMPVYDGWAVLEELRSHSEVPILMLTALGGDHYEIQGLRHGADDYLSKPFSYEVLLARINALLRKTIKARESCIKIGAIEIHQDTHQVIIENTEIILNNKEYNLLVYLIKNANIILSREQILENVWGYDFDGDIRTIDAHIKMLRGKLGKSSKYISTVRGSGYIFKVIHEKDS